VEKAIRGRELECGVLELPDGSVEASTVGEIRVEGVRGREDGFYDFATKYLDDGAELDVPAKIDDDVATRVRELAIREGAKPDGGRELDTLAYPEAFVIGTAQSAALVAGISRDGITMGAGLGRGLDHSDAARYAFLLATPIILAAGIFKLPDLLGHLGNGIRGQALVACISAAITAVFTVAFLVRWFKTRTLVPFAIYGLVFGGAMVIYTQT